MKKTIAKQQKRERRHTRIRARVVGTPERPRFAIHKSNSHVTAQIIDDSTGKTLAHATSTTKAITGTTMTDRAKAVGEQIAKQAKEKGVTRVVFDRGGFQYIGIIKIVADTVRDAGITL